MDRVRLRPRLLARSESNEDQRRGGCYLLGQLDASKPYVVPGIVMTRLF